MILWFLDLANTTLQHNSPRLHTFSDIAQTINVVETPNLYVSVPCAFSRFNLDSKRVVDSSYFCGVNRAMADVYTVVTWILPLVVAAVWWRAVRQTPLGAGRTGRLPEGGVPQGSTLLHQVWGVHCYTHIYTQIHTHTHTHTHTHILINAPQMTIRLFN